MSKTRGLKPFQPGQSGNPGGRPKEDPEVKKLAKEYTVRAVERLAFWLESDNPKASVAAANSLLDRGWGKPAQALVGEDGKAIQHALTVRWANNESSGR